MNLQFERPLLIRKRSSWVENEELKNNLHLCFSAIARIQIPSQSHLLLLGSLCSPSKQQIKSHSLYQNGICLKEKGLLFLRTQVAVCSQTKGETSIKNKKRESIFVVVYFFVSFLFICQEGHLVLIHLTEQHRLVEFLSLFSAFPNLMYLSKSSSSYPPQTLVWGSCLRWYNAWQLWLVKTTYITVSSRIWSSHQSLRRKSSTVH